MATVHLLGWRPILYVECNEYCQRIIQRRIKDGLMPDAPIWGDIRTLGPRVLRPYKELAKKHPVVVTAGFPCQPWSVAGRMEAQDDSRNLWPDTIRVISEVRPRWCLLENVPGLLAKSHGYFGQILQDLAESGYDARWKVLSAAELGAPHKRDRLWIVAVANTDGAELWLESGRSGGPCGQGSSEFGNDGAEESMAHAEGKRTPAAEQPGSGHGSVTSSQDVAHPHGSRQLQPPRSKRQKRGRAGDGGPAFPYSDDQRQSRPEQSQMVGEEQDS